MKIISFKKIKKLHTKLRSNRGFTLIELLIVLIIIAILAGIAIPRYMSSTTKAKQTEAKELLNQIYLLERSHFQINDEYWIPEEGVIADKDHPDAFIELGVEIMASARYKYEITGDQDHFIATATATRLDDDPAIDQWQIDESGILKAIVDDSKTK
ncbi:MAG: prepilin-type N-terminal cleavage/methylation domain-containing protein [Candidatus Zixiibacteriota bacterium]